MNSLRQIINDLDKQPIQKYGALAGKYYSDGISFVIRNIRGGAVKRCTVDIEIPTGRLYDISCGESDLAAVSSYILRDFYAHVRVKNSEMQLSETKAQRGFFYFYQTGQRVLPNSIVLISGDTVKIKLDIKLPSTQTAFDGKILDMSAKQVTNQIKKRKREIISVKSLKILLVKNLPELVQGFIDGFSQDSLFEAVILNRRQRFIRRYISENGYVSFLGDGASLPRLGMTDYKNPRNAVYFKSPESMRVTIPLPDGGKISGMAIKEGVTVILGDSYQGKSTLLSAIYEGVYDHIPGDGREYVITVDSAVNITAETGRCVDNADISFYLNCPPPQVKSAKSFTTASASGSTAQASSVFEAYESGARLMLFDEDSCANNFMYKDDRIRNIFGKSSTSPFIDSAREFYSRYKISSIIAVEASAQYLDIADRALVLRDYEVYEYTDYRRRDYPHKPLTLKPRMLDLGALRAENVIQSLSCSDSSVKIGTSVIDITTHLTNPTTGQAEFVVRVLKDIILYSESSGKTLKSVLEGYYSRIDGSCKGVASSGGEYLEYVRPQSIMEMLYRCKFSKFIRRSL